MTAFVVAGTRHRIAAAMLCASALSCPIAAHAQPANNPAAAAPDFSGIWNKDRGRMGAVANVSEFPSMVIGDYKNPILQPWAAAQVKARGDMERAGDAAPEAKMTCWPGAVPNVLTLGGGDQILQTPKMVIILYGSDHQWRFVYLNEPHSAHPSPSWFGESVGHYEGDTLVVDTIGIAAKPMSLVDDFGTPHTDALHVVERYHLTDGGKGLKVDVLVDDPGTFTKKWTASAGYTRGNNPINESVCAANNRLDVYGPSIGKMPEAKYVSPFEKVLFRTALALAAMLTVAAAQAQKAPGAEGADISGVWWASSYSPRIQPMDGGELPFTPAGKAAYDKNMAGLKNGSVIDKARTLCVLDGVPRILETPYPFDIVQTPGQISFLFEQNRTLRIVGLAAKAPSQDAMADNPRYDGYITGHWEGDTLVIQSVGFNDVTFLDAYGAPHTDEMRVTERVRTIAGGKQLEDVVTVEDPKLYTKPWSARFVYDSHPEVRLETYVCGEQHRDLKSVKGVKGF